MIPRKFIYDVDASPQQNFRARLRSRPFCFFGGDLGSSKSSTQASQPVSSTSGAGSPSAAGGSNAKSVISTGSGQAITDVKGDVIVQDENAIAQMAALVNQVLNGAGGALQQILDASRTVIEQNSADTANTNDAVTQLAQSTLQSNAALAAAGQSGGQTTFDKTLTWIILGLAALVAAVLIWRKK